MCVAVQVYGSSNSSSNLYAYVCIANFTYAIMSDVQKVIFTVWNSLMNAQKFLMCLHLMFFFFPKNIL